MPRHLACTALLTLLAAFPGHAQEAAPAAPTELEQSGLTPPTVLSQGYASDGTDVLVTRLLGETVYSSVDDEAQEIGTISDMVVTSGQGITAVVISVGGVLGVGSKDVAVDFSQLDWAERPDGSRRWVLAIAPQALADAPAFIWAESETATGETPLTPQQEQDQLTEGDPNAAPVDSDLTTDQGERPAINTPLDRTGFSDFDGTDLSADELRGVGVYGINDEQIGTISDIVTNPDGSFDALIVDVGGFLGLGAKPVAVGFDNLTFSADTFGNRYLFLNASREQLEAQAPYDPATYEGDRENQRMVITP